jgi:ATP-binding cassette subfamily F protein 3
LALVKLLLDPPNFLLMDEPTTHLDMGSIDAVIGALKEFTGTLVFISHDVYFIRALATKVIHVNAGRLTAYAGGYDYYLEKSKAGSAREALTAGLTNARPAAPTPVAAAPTSSAPGPRDMRNQKERKAEASELRKRIGNLKREVEGIETDITRLEERQSSLTQELQRPETYTTPGRAVEINTELSRIQSEMSAKVTAWESTSAQLERLEKSEA